MGIDDFITGDNDNSSTSTTTSTQSTSKEITSVELSDLESVDEGIPEPERHDVDPDKYEKEYLKQCYRCGDKSVLIPALSELGNIWFCSNQDCFGSVSHHVNNLASSKQISNEVDAQAIHNWMNNQTDEDPREMGIDDFMSDDSSSSTDNKSSNSDTDDNETKSTPDTTSSTSDVTDPIESSDMTFYGTGEADVGENPMERKGAMSNHTTSQLMKHSSGEIHCDRDDVKFHSATFPVLSIDDEYEQGSHYTLKYDGDAHSTRWHNRVVSCISLKKTTLGEMNKEVIMFAVGTPSKSIAMDRLQDSLDDDLDGDTEIYLNFFGDTMFMRDLSQANMEYREEDRLNIDKIGSRLLNRDMLRVGLNQQESNDGS